MLAETSELPISEDEMAEDAPEMVALPLDGGDEYTALMQDFDVLAANFAKASEIAENFEAENTKLPAAGN